MSIINRGYHYDNCLVSVDQERSLYGDPNINVEFMHGPFKLSYSGPRGHFKDSFKGELERFAKKVARDYDDYFYIMDRHADCFEYMIKDFETLECPYWIGDIDMEEVLNDQD